MRSVRYGTVKFVNPTVSGTHTYYFELIWIVVIEKGDGYSVDGIVYSYFYLS